MELNCCQTRSVEGMRNLELIFMWFYRFGKRARRRPTNGFPGPPGSWRSQPVQYWAALLKLKVSFRIYWTISTISERSASICPRGSQFAETATFCIENGGESVEASGPKLISGQRELRCLFGTSCIIQDIVYCLRHWHGRPTRMTLFEMMKIPKTINGNRFFISLILWLGKSFAFRSHFPALYELAGQMDVLGWLWIAGWIFSNFPLKFLPTATVVTTAAAVVSFQEFWKGEEKALDRQKIQKLIFLLHFRNIGRIGEDRHSAACLPVCLLWQSL